MSLYTSTIVSYVFIDLFMVIKHLLETKWLLQVERLKDYKSSFIEDYLNFSTVPESKNNRPHLRNVISSVIL